MPDITFFFLFKKCIDETHLREYRNKYFCNISNICITHHLEPPVTYFVPCQYLSHAIWPLQQIKTYTYSLLYGSERKCTNKFIDINFHVCTTHNNFLQ